MISPICRPQSPQMHITDHVMSHKFADPLDTLSNDSRAQMSDMQWLGNIGPAVIYNNGLRMCRFVTAKSSLICFHIADIFRQIGRTYFHIDKSRFYRLYALKQFVFCQRLRNLIRNHEWCTLVLLLLQPLLRYTGIHTGPDDWKV